MKTACQNGAVTGPLRGRRYNRAKRQGARTDLTSPHNEDKFKTSGEWRKVVYWLAAATLTTVVTW